METNIDVSPAIQAFQSFYLSELDQRVQRSAVVGAVTAETSNAAVFFDEQAQKFTLVEKPEGAEAANVFDCTQREQWGRTVMLFGHATHTGGFIPSGHATLNGKNLRIKLASGQTYNIEVDPQAPCLLPYVQVRVEKPPRPAPTRKNNAGEGRGPRPQKPQREVHGRSRPEDDAPSPSLSQSDDESEDFTAEDLARLRGEIPLAQKSKKKWRK